MWGNTMEQDKCMEQYQDWMWYEGMRCGKDTKWDEGTKQSKVSALDKAVQSSQAEWTWTPEENFLLVYIKYRQYKYKW